MHSPACERRGYAVICRGKGGKGHQQAAPSCIFSASSSSRLLETPSLVQQRCLLPLILPLAIVLEASVSMSMSTSTPMSSSETTDVVDGRGFGFSFLRFVPAQPRLSAVLAGLASLSVQARAYQMPICEAGGFLGCSRVASSAVYAVSVCRVPRNIRCAGEPSRPTGAGYEIAADEAFAAEDVQRALQRELPHTACKVLHVSLIVAKAGQGCDDCFSCPT